MSTGIVEMQQIHVGPYMDKVGRRVYLCEVGMLMDDGEWHDGVSWEVAEGDIQLHELATFHGCEKSAVGSMPIIPDWSRPSATARMEAGVPARDVLGGKGKGRSVRHRASGDLCSLFYRLATTETERAVSSFYHNMGTAENSHRVVGVILALHETLGKGAVVELLDPAGTFFFVQEINVQCTDGELEGGETDLTGFFCRPIAEVLACPFERGADFDQFLEWERLASKSMVAFGSHECIQAAQVKRTLTALQPAFWEDHLVDLDGFVQFCGWSNNADWGAGEKVTQLHVAAMAVTPPALYGYSCLHFGQARGYLELVKTNIVNSTFQYLRNQTRKNTPEDVHRLSLTVENVPSVFLYWALGRRWFLRRPSQVEFNTVSYMHIFSGTTKDFVPFFGRDLYGILDRGKTGNEHVNDPRLRVGISVDPTSPTPTGRAIPTVRLKYSMKRPGSLLIQFASLRKWGPYRNDVAQDLPNCPLERERALRMVMWDTNTRARQKNRALSGAQ